jgi:hypothetical protein
MTEIRSIKLEIVRPGPAHNQLLSPLTPYLILCGAEGPITVNFPFEQRQLLSRLERLRYAAEETSIAQSQREAELRDFGELIGKILGEVPGLLAELGGMQHESLIHLRLSLSAFELGLIPFEAAISPDGFPGSGSPLLLQSKTPISLTREVRRGRPLPIEWNRPPRILFVFASPPGMRPVPCENHLSALRRAVDPWVSIKDDENDKLTEVKKLLTVLPQATLEQIRQACADTEFTHVHILAHGAPHEEEGDRKFGLALCSDADPNQVDIVNGERLAIALSTDRATTRAVRWRPTIVTLATCDSANVNSVIAPAGSIAHELHAAGIPWVFASQFPLWMKASTIYTDVLYKRLLQGADPRCVLHEVRQRLRTSCPETHDWASIVAYATVPKNFEKQVAEFRDKHTNSKIEIKFARIDDLIRHVTDCRDRDRAVENKAIEEEIEMLCKAIRRDLLEWREDASSTLTPKESAIRSGLSGAAEKRIGIAYDLLRKIDREESSHAYQNSINFYREAVRLDSSNHWVITQYLSLLAIVSLELKDKTTTSSEYRDWWNGVRETGRRQLQFETDKSRVWICGTLAELELLGSVYAGDEFNESDAIGKIEYFCRELLESCVDDRFPIQSTERQFRRYIEIWKSPKWEACAKAAINTLSREPSVVGG